MCIRDRARLVQQRPRVCGEASHVTPGSAVGQTGSGAKGQIVLMVILSSDGHKDGKDRATDQILLPETTSVYLTTEHGQAF